MALEDLTGTSKFINHLVKTNPANVDYLVEADDHLRGIKNVLLNTFPNVTGAITTTQAELNRLVGDLATVRSNLGVRKDKVDATVAPTATNDSGEGYSVGSLWLNVTTDIGYLCIDASAGAAIWIRLAKNPAPSATQMVAGSSTGELAALSAATALQSYRMNAAGTAFEAGNFGRTELIAFDDDIASGGSVAVVTISDIPSGFRAYYLDIVLVSNTGDAEPEVAFQRVSDDLFDTSTGDYALAMAGAPAQSAPGTAGSTSSNVIRLRYNKIGSGANPYHFWGIRAALVQLHSASWPSGISGNLFQWEHSGGIPDAAVFYGTRKANVAHDGIRFDLDTGLFEAGYYALWGMK